MEIAGWVCAALSLLGTIINVERKDPRCFWLWMPGNLLFGVWDIYKGIYPQAALMFIYFGLAVRGIHLWRD